MNKIFKLSETAQNDVESVCIEVKSVPAKFGGPGIPRTVTRTVPSTVPICLQSTYPDFWRENWDSSFGSSERV